MSEFKVLFIDDGGVISDNNLRFPQWQDLVAQYFSPRYGGTFQKWRLANSFALNQLMQRYDKKVAGNPEIDFNKYWVIEQSQWLTDMFNTVKISPPPYEERVLIAREATDWITPRVRASFPGVAKTIRYLKKEGFKLCTASGEVSWELKGYLSGLNIDDCFDEFYGPDLINVAKEGVFFYKKIFEDVGIDPKTALVIDDSAEKLSFALKLGASTVHVFDSNQCRYSACQHHIDQLKELPRLLPEINVP